MTNKNMKILPYLFILPSLALVALFYYYAFGSAFYFSFTDYRMGYKVNFIGFENYIQLFTDEVFLKSAVNLFIFLVTDVMKLISFPLIAAALLYFIKSKAASETIKRLFIFPMLVPGIVGVLMWVNIYSPSMGILNSFLDVVGLGTLKHDWLNESTAMGAIIFMGFPFISGLNFLIFHAALGTISKEIGEAAEIDGCKSFQLFHYIHLPYLSPYIGTCATLTIIGSMQDYVKILVTSKGGPNGFDTYVPSLMLFNRAFRTGEMGYASSIGMVLFVAILLFSMVTFKFTRKSEKGVM